MRQPYIQLSFKDKSQITKRQKNFIVGMNRCSQLLIFTLRIFYCNTADTKRCVRTTQATLTVINSTSKRIYFTVDSDIFSLTD